MNRIFASALILVASAVPAFAGVVTVPEPTTMSLFGLGAGGVYLVKRFIGRR